MGLVQAVKGAVGGVLADQWKDFYTVPTGLPSTAALFAAVPRGTNAGRGSNTSGSSNIISNGSKIIVPEGYGLLLAEAIWLGKPTLATGWSSNVEFMDPASSLLVDYDLIPVEGDGAIYRSGRWADARVDDAAAKLGRMLTDAAWRAGLAAATAHNAHVSFDREAWLRMRRDLLPLSP